MRTVKLLQTCPPSKTARYKGVREPRCQGGEGCWACWAKWALKNPEKARKFQ